ncbi:MAG: c-type cytochrome [Acidobacteriota bacterium]
MSASAGYTLAILGMPRIHWTLATAALVAAIPQLTHSYVGSGPRRIGVAGVQAAGQVQVGPAAVAAGGRLFRERCADCHGGDAKGSRGPDLTGLWVNAAADDRAFQIIRTGIPGSIMPPSPAPDEELRAVIAYLRSIGTAGAGERSAGNAINGERIFSASCGGCHRVGGRGGRLGPDLSQIGNQPRQALARSIRQASDSFALGYEPVVLVMSDGRQIRGARKSEDPFSIQIMDTGERLQGYLKADLRDLTRDSKSLMPDFGPDRLDAAALDDLLGFLATLRATR